MELLVRDLQMLTGRYGSEEARAWGNSLFQLSATFSAPSFQPLHLYFGSRGNLALEYQLPASSSWCDVVMLGAHGSKPAAVIIELKDWMTRSDKPGRFEGLIERQGAQELHPSDQVRGYVEYCRRFHSAVADANAEVHGCVLLTRDVWAPAYALAPNQALAEQYPLFTTAAQDRDLRLPNFFRERLNAPDPDFAQSFEVGRYRQNRGFVAQIAQQILHPKAEVLELLDNQRKAFAICRATIANTFFRSPTGTPQKRVVIINGPPGSGKSVIAARLWASLVTDPRLPKGDVVFTTTSQSQNSNWADIFQRRTKIEGARGVIRKATSYTPIDTKRVGYLRQIHGRSFIADGKAWRKNLALLQALGEKCRDGALENQNLVTIVDEAHALINPENPGGGGQFGFATSLGPQGYHIIRSSILSVFLLDPLQGFRERENTTVAEIHAWSHELGAGDPAEISLEGAQFRCAGSTEYITWVENVLGGEPPNANRELARAWRRATTAAPSKLSIVPFPDSVRGEHLRAAEDAPVYAVPPPRGSARQTNAFDFQIFDNPESWENELHLRCKAGNSARIFASYCREWTTADASDPHKLPPELMDFHEQYSIGNERRFWSRIWNFVPKRGTDYTWYVAAHPAGKIADDPLCEVGCPYAVRGFDYDYVGIIWLDDLVWRNGEWRVNPESVHESGIRDLRAAALNELPPGRLHAALRQRVAQSYRILFSRALMGVYVWVPDDETRDYVQSSL
jgi:hypothetical protein